jgi:hypothetical protein
MLSAFSFFHLEDCPVLSGILGFKSSESFTVLHRQLVQPVTVTAFSRQTKATLLHVPLQCSQMDFNQLVIWIVNEWQPTQGGIWSSSVNTGIDVFDLQHVKVNGKEVV